MRVFGSMLVVLFLLSGSAPSMADGSEAAIRKAIQSWYAGFVETYSLRDGLDKIPTVTDPCDVEVSDGSIHKTKKSWLEWSERDLNTIDAVRSGGITIERIEKVGSEIVFVGRERWALLIHDTGGFWGPKNKNHEVVWTQKSRFWLVRSPQGLLMRKARSLTDSEEWENGKLIAVLYKTKVKK